MDVSTPTVVGGKDLHFDMGTPRTAEEALARRLGEQRARAATLAKIAPDSGDFGVSYTVCGDAYWSGPGVECRRGVGVVRAYNPFNHFTRFARSVGRVSLVLVFWVSM